MKRIVLLLLSLCLLLLCACSTQNELQAARSDAEKLTEEKEAVQNELTATKDQLNAVREELDSIKGSMEAIIEELQRTQNELATAKEALEDTQEHYKDLLEGYSEEDVEEYLMLLKNSGKDIDKIKKELAAEQERKRQEELQKQAEEAKGRAEEERKRAEEEKKKQQQEQESSELYEKLARTPDKYKDKKVTFIGMVVEVIENDGTNILRLSVHKTNGQYDNDQILYCTYKSSLLKYRLLEKDIITITGTSKGIITYQSTTGRTIQIPSVKVEKIEMKQ